MLYQFYVFLPRLIPLSRSIPKLTCLVFPTAAAVKAYDSGRGVWPRMTPKQRIDHVEKYLAGLRAKRDEIVNLLMWEICKNAADAAKEVDRTIKVRPTYLQT